MDKLKLLLKNKALLAVLVAGLVAGVGMLVGVPSGELKDAYCNCSCPASDAALVPEPVKAEK